MSEPLLILDPHAREAIWDAIQTPVGQRVPLPWGVVWRGEELGAGMEVWVEAWAPFTLVVHGDRVMLLEPIQPGRHRLLLTRLDSTEVREWRD